MSSKDLIIIVDPGAEVMPATAKTMAPRLQSLSGARIGLIDNSKHMAAPLLHAVEHGLKTRYGVGTVRYYRKGNASIPTPPQALLELVATCDAIVHGVAD